jgi:Major tropism determinant N-terminal domain
MATKIQLRRDTSANWQGTNPVLAQGEPGVELDTKRMKVGDGVSTWNTLAYVSSGGASESSTTNMFVKLDAIDGELGPNWSGVISVSEDGLNWTPSTFNQQYTNYEGWGIYHVAVGNGVVVYHTYDLASDRDELRWAYNPFDKPNLPLGTGGDASRLGPNGEAVAWINVRFVGNKFVAVGYYFDSVKNDFNYPYAAYSTDGASWTRISFDLTFIQGLIAAERGANSNDVNGMMATDVAYGDNGWLFAMHWGPMDASGGNHNAANAYFATDITAQIGSAQLVTGIPGSFTLKNDGKGWVAWTDYGSGNLMYINGNSDPRTGSWTLIDMDEVSASLTGIGIGSITDVVAGPINGVHWIVVGSESHGSFATNDQGATWRFVETGAEITKIRHISNTNPAYLTDYWGNLTDTDGEKVTITGSNISQLNGTFYVHFYNGDHGYQSYLYAAYDPNTNTFSSPLDATSWGDVNTEVDVNLAVNYGDRTAIVSDATNLRVGMAAEGYIQGFGTLEDWIDNEDPNTIEAINGNQITMKYPWNSGNVSDYSYAFYPLLQNTYGDGITSMAYGDGAFIGFSKSYPGARSYRTTDLNSWVKTSRGNVAQFGPWADNFSDSVAYGEVTAGDTLLINSSETVPGYASYLSVGDSFKVSVSGGDPEWTSSPLAEGFSTGGIEIDPDLSQWYMGVIQDVEGWYTTHNLGIGTYRTGSEFYSNDRHDSVNVVTPGFEWKFDNDTGTFYGDNLYINNTQNAYIYTDYGSAEINAPIDGYENDTTVYGYNSNSGYAEGYASMSYHDDRNFVKVDYYGVQLFSGSENNGTSYHARWTFTNDCNTNNWGVMYQPESAVIQTSGYWAIGDYQNQSQSVYIKATNWYDSYPRDILFSAEGHSGGDTGAAFVMGRHGQFEVITGDGIFQSTGEWAVGDYAGNHSYTYVGAYPNQGLHAYDITIAANDTYWYFNRDGTLQLPVGGDITDHNGVSVLSREMPQTAKSSDGDYTIQLSDRGGHIYVTSTGNLLVPTHASVAFPIGTVITVVTGGSNTTHIKAVDSGTTTLVLSNTGPANADSGIAVGADTYVTMLKVENDRWIVQVA